MWNDNGANGTYTQNWNGSVWNPSSYTSTYNETAGTCRYVCASDYHRENNQCVSNTRTANCPSKPANTVWNDNGANGTYTQTWSSSSGWSLSSSSYSTTAGVCKYKCDSTHTWEGGSCINQKTTSCPSKPANTVWNDNGANGTYTQTWSSSSGWSSSYSSSYSTTAGVCKYKCDSTHTWEGGSCINQKTTSCPAKPANTVWNDNGANGTYTQTWNSSSGWSSTYSSTYNTTAGICRYKCDSAHTWEGGSCINQKTASCSSKPANTVWNDNGANGTYTQNWNGSVWNPSSYTSTYNETAGTCRYVCASDYHQENNQCVSNTRTANCPLKPANSTWNGDSTYTQNWSDSSWTPVYPLKNSGTAGTCRFVCNEGYNYNGSTCVVPLTVGSICTGQNKCYATSGTMTCPASGEDFFGQDAQYATSGSCTPQSFTVIETGIENENIVQDHNTWLQWQQTPSTETFTWGEAVAHCKNLDYGGYDDWRLPTPNEFLTIVDNSKYYPAVDTTYFVNMPASSFFWTSKDYDSSKAFYFYSYGNIYYASTSNTYRAVCVRGNELLTGSFTSSTAGNGDITVTDSLTGLIWQKTYVSGKNWHDALEYCENLDYAGYTDWKLPNKNELASLLNHDKLGSPYSNFPDMPDNYFWSSSTFSASVKSAWGVVFEGGYVNHTNKQHNYYVRCVRSDICENGKFWNGSQCVNNPCEANNCNHTHETGNCQPRTASTFECMCENGYFWNGSACLSPCDSHSCGAHSDGNCTALSLDVFYCGCDEGYSWNGGSCKEYSTGLTLGNICTGQTKCFDNSAEIECPDEGEDFFGQDAQYAALGYCTPQKFTFKGYGDNKIVVDNNTELQWQQSIPTEKFTWEEAYIYCDSLTYGGYSDWRLPTPTEFLSIVDNSKYNPAIDTTYFVNMPTDIDAWSKDFWTSKTFDSSSAVGFGVYSGGIDYVLKSNECHAMCVRGNELPTGLFTSSTAENGDVVITDSTTELIWQGTYISIDSWQLGLEYCENLDYAGYTDWRLPNKNELASLLNYDKKSSPYSDFPNILSSKSSTTWFAVTDNNWGIENFGRVYNGNKGYTGNVRCVRNSNCAADELWNGIECVPNTQTVPCTGLPANADWNTVDEITQTWNGTEWLPPAEGVYNEESSDSECRFGCNMNYTWNPDTSLCDADTQTTACTTDKPENSVWNDNGANGWFTQTWNGTGWTPETFNAVYNTTAGECRFKCIDNYHWENSACIYNTKTNVECTGLIANAHWNGASTITQTWSGSSWTPTSAGSYNENETTAGCYFKCNDTYFYFNSQCLNPCDQAECDSYNNATGSCSASAWNQYTCECVDDYYWRGSQQGCDDRRLTFANICTGMQKCYISGNSALSNYCPASNASYYGQDAQYAEMGYCTPKNFSIDTTVADEKTTIDHNLSLEWQHTVAQKTWSNAVSYCETSTYGGHSDWRLPTLHELLSIIDESQDYPYVDSRFFPNITEGSFWSSSEFANDSSQVWRTNFNTISSSSKNSNSYVLCVRSDEAIAQSGFTILKRNGDTIVRDNATRLIWQQTFNSGLTWQNSLTYCENLNYAGYSDWRLPNKNELISLTAFDRNNPASKFPDMPSGYYFWSSTVDSTGRDDSYDGCSSRYIPYLFTVNFSTGSISILSDNENHAYDSAVRCVRTDNCTSGIWNGSACVAEQTRVEDCTDLPENAHWNTVYQITQTLINGEWVPSAVGSYSTQPSDIKCNFVCDAMYGWKNGRCVDSCEGNPCEGVANSTEVCTPLTVSTYSCGCIGNYTWDGEECKADTQTVLCTGLPANAQWHSTSITQTWDGSDWIPTNVGVYSENAQSGTCSFSCKLGYDWDEDSGTCQELPYYCGNGVIDAVSGELCDDGKYNGKYGYCNETCTGRGQYCGDGILQSGYEQCDTTSDGKIVYGGASFDGSCEDSLVYKTLSGSSTPNSGNFNVVIPGIYEITVYGAQGGQGGSGYRDLGGNTSGLTGGETGKNGNMVTARYYLGAGTTLTYFAGKTGGNGAGNSSDQQNSGGAGGGGGSSDGLAGAQGGSGDAGSALCKDAGGGGGGGGGGGSSSVTTGSTTLISAKGGDGGAGGHGADNKSCIITKNGGDGGSGGDGGGSNYYYTNTTGSSYHYVGNASLTDAANFENGKIEIKLVKYAPCSSCSFLTNESDFADCH